MLNRSFRTRDSRSTLTLGIISAFLLSVLAFSGCVSQNTQQSSQEASQSSQVLQQPSETYDEDRYSGAIPFGAISEVYLEEFEKCYSQSKSAQSNGSTDDLLYMYRVIDTGGINYDIKISAKLSGDVDKNDEILLGVHPTRLKVFLDGQPAKLEDIKPGYLLSFYGKDLSISLVGMTDTSTGESLDMPLEPVTFINAWTANQSDN